MVWRIVWKNPNAIVSMLIGLIGLANICGYARGGVLSGLPSIFGPGISQGVPVGETVNVNNDNVGAGNPNRISLVGIDIVGLGPIDLSVPVANSPGVSGTTEYFIELGSAVNMTEAAWNGFVIELGSGIGSEFLCLSDFAIPGVSGLDFDTPDRDSVVSSPSFLSITHDADVLVFSEGIVEIGEFASGQNFSIDVPDITTAFNSTYDFTIRLQAVPVLEVEGDFEQDGDVDGVDFLIWQQDPNLGSLTDWQTNFGRVEVDFDHDGDVDGADFLAWQREPSLGSLADWQANFGRAVSLTGSLVAVPEPTRMSLLFVAVLLCVAARNARP